jgi:hypothetical protein
MSVGPTSSRWSGTGMKATVLHVHSLKQGTPGLLYIKITEYSSSRTSIFLSLRVSSLLELNRNPGRYSNPLFINSSTASFFRMLLTSLASLMLLGARDEPSANMDPKLVLEVSWSQNGICV